MSRRFNPPPGWPPPPSPGWLPPPEWQPDPAWPPPPPGWQLVVDDPAPPGHAGQANWFLRHKLLTGLAALFAILIIAGVASGGGGKSPPNSGTTSATSAAPTTKASGQSAASGPTARLGTPVRDGKFQFTVTNVRCNVTELGTPPFGTKAQGQFCLVTVKVQNIGDRAQTLFDGGQYLYDASGRRFSASSEAGIYANPNDQQVFITPINPGNAVTGSLVFDIPKGVTPTKIELHDSAFSGGVVVIL